MIHEHRAAPSHAYQAQKIVKNCLFQVAASREFRGIPIRSRDREILLFVLLDLKPLETTELPLSIIHPQSTLAMPYCDMRRLDQPKELRCIADNTTQQPHRRIARGKQAENRGRAKYC